MSGLSLDTCRHCGRNIMLFDGRWVDPEATGDDSVWRETCDQHDTFTAEHEPQDFSDLPQYCKDYSPEQTERVVEWLSRLGLDELRRRQAITNEQIGMAYAKATQPAPPSWAEATLEDLQGRADQLMQAVGRWLDRKNGARK